MKIKVSKHKLNIHYRGSPWGSRTQQHAYCLRYALSHHTESHFGKKQPQAKIAIAFLFGQLHFNDVTSHALFYGSLDYCNSLLYKVPALHMSKLQRIQNSATRLVCSTPRCNHITPILLSLRWLPVAYHIESKILVLTFKAIYQLAPSYICNLVR